MNKLEYIARSLSRGTNKKYETYVINAIYQKVSNPNLEIETQKVIKLNDGYSPLIDLYLPQLEIAIEVDESYHDSERQKNHDLWREDSINSQVRKSCIGDSIRFERVKVSSGDIEAVNKRIDELVSYIKEKIDERTEPLVWLSDDEKIEKIKERGTIEVNDCFYNNVQIINIVYGKNYKGWQKAGYKSLWFPVMSDKLDDNSLTNRSSWQNFFNSSKTVIYERSTSKETNENKKGYAIKDQQNITTRIVFVKDRDTFGVSRKRFAGVFQARGWDDNLQAQIWKLLSTEIDIPLEN